MKLNPAAITTPLRYSLLTISPASCPLSVLKKAEDKDALIVRLFNPSLTSACDAAVTFNRLTEVTEVGMDEQQLTAEKNRSGMLRPCQSQTLCVTFK